MLTETSPRPKCRRASCWVLEHIHEWKKLLTGRKMKSNIAWTLSWWWMMYVMCGGRVTSLRPIFQAVWHRFSFSGFADWAADLKSFWHILLWICLSPEAGVTVEDISFMQILILCCCILQTFNVIVTKVIICISTELSLPSAHPVETPMTYDDVCKSLFSN